MALDQPGASPGGNDLQTLITVMQNLVVAVNNVTKQLNATTTLFPVSAATSASATAGVNGAPPVQVAGYLVTMIGSTTVKFPYYFV